MLKAIEDKTLKCEVSQDGNRESSSPPTLEVGKRETSEKSLGIEDAINLEAERLERPSLPAWNNPSDWEDK